MRVLLVAWLLKRPVAWAAMLFVALAVFVNIVVFSVTEGMLQGFWKQAKRQSAADVTISHREPSGALSQRWEATDYLAILGKLQLKGPTGLVLETAGLVGVGGDRMQGALLRGVTSKDMNRLFTIKERDGALISQALTRREGGEIPLILPSALAQGLGLRVGDKVELYAVVPSRPEAMVEKPRTRRVEAQVALVRPFESFDDRQSVFLPFEQMQGFLNHDPADPVATRAVASLEVGDPKLLRSEVERIQGILEGSRNPDGAFEAEAWTARMDWMGQAEREMRMIQIVVIFILVLAACAIFLMVNLLMKSKVRTLGLLMAMGVSPSRIAILVLLYSVGLSLCGGVAGWLAGWRFMAHIDPIHDWLMFEVLKSPHGIFDGYGIFDKFPSAYSHPMALSLALATAILCFLSAIIPAILASRLQPAEVLKSE